MPACIRLDELQQALGGEFCGDPASRVRAVASLRRAGPDELSFVVSERHIDAALASAAGVLIVPPDLAHRLGDRPMLKTANPHAIFARAAALLHPEPGVPVGIHPEARIGSGCTIAADVHISAGVSIGEGCVIGAGSRIDPGCVLGAGVRLGTNCRLHPNVTVYADCVVGDRVILHAGCVIGADGFGLAWEGESWVKVPQIGRVLIGDDVEIGANTTIDRGALDDTVIEDGVKIDNLVQIAHNCVIGAHTAIAGCAGIAGSTRIGRHCLIGGAAMILGHIEIGDRVTVSGASFIGKSIREPGTYTSTQPQMPHPDWLRNAAQLRHLAEMRDRIRALEKKLDTLERTSK